MTEPVYLPVQEPEDRLNPKQVFQHVKAAGRYLKSRWHVIFFSALLFGAAGFVYSFLKPPYYVAEMTFALDEGAGGPANAPVPISEQIIRGGSIDAGGIFSSITNIVELMQSRLLIEKTLRTPLQLNGKTKTYADFFLDSLKYRAKWIKDSSHQKIDFAVTDGKDSLFQNGILYNIFQILTGEMIKIDQKGKGTTIISVMCMSKNEAFSKQFLEAWMSEVTKFYISTKTERAKITLAFITKRMDSVRNAYNIALYGKAAFSDAMINPVRQTASISTEKRQTDIQILKASYMELVQSFETAKNALLRDTPLIQYIDIPILPLKQLRSALMKITLVGFFIGLVLAVAWLLFRKLLQYLNAP